MKTTLSELKSRYIGLGVYGAGIGRFSGNRTCYLESCDGRTAVVWLTTGERKKFPRAKLAISAVYDREGNKLRWRFNKGTGHLEVVVEDKWHDVCPWEKPEKPVKEADTLEDILDDE